MKVSINYFACSLVCIIMCIFTSCADECENDDHFRYDVFDNLTWDGSFITNLALTDPKAPTISTDPSYDKTAPYQVEGYNELILQLRFTSDINIVTYLDEVVPREDFEKAIRQIVKYENSKNSFIISDLNRFYDEHAEKKSEFIQLYYFAYIDRGPSITCDKTLFGLEAGTNLCKHFKICDDMIKWPHCIPSGIEKPDLLYRCGDEMPESMDMFFSEKSWIRPYYNIRLIDTPAEEYDELTFHLSFPLIVEHTIDYAIEQFKGGKPERKFSKRVLEADCHIVFNRE